ITSLGSTSRQCAVSVVLSLGMVIQADAERSAFGQEGRIRRKAEIRVIHSQLTTLPIERDLQEATYVRSDLPPGEEAQLSCKEHRTVLRAGQCLLGAGVGRLEHQRHRRHQVEQQALLPLGALALKRLTPPEHVAVELEG